MNSIRVYLAGGMSGLSMDEQNKWRLRIKDAVLYGGYSLDKKVHFFNPVEHYTLFSKEHKTEREVMEYDLYNLKRSDVVIVNFNAPHSLGTAMELMCAKENNIPVIGLNKDNAKLHPWLVECCIRICDTYKELLDYFVNYFCFN